MITVVAFVAITLALQPSQKPKVPQQFVNNGSSAVGQTQSSPNNPAQGQLRSEDREIQRKIEIFTGGLVIVGLIQALVLAWQASVFGKTLRAISRQAGIMLSQTKVAKHTLKDIKEQTRLLGEYVKATKDGVDAARESADAAKGSADALVNSERAWILAQLNWYERGLHVGQGTSSSKDEVSESTTVNVKLICRNEGRSPAWIQNVSGKVEIVSVVTPGIENMPDLETLDSFGPMEPLGPGVQLDRGLQLTCPGHVGDGEFLSVYVLIRYMDIFGRERRTSLGYSIDRSINLNRQDGMPERNQNT